MPGLDHPPTLGRRLRQALPSLTPAERRLARLLLGQGEASAFDTLQRLADASGTSPPTILRFADKLGLTGYAALKAAVLEETEARRDSALSQFTRSRGVASRQGRHRERARDHYPAALAETFATTSDVDFDAAAALLADTSRQIVFAGGRFSQSVAEQFYRHMTLLRPGVDLIAYGAQNRLERAEDLGRGHVLFILDFRRYQADSVSLARLAKRNRAMVALLTDPWLSPIADRADLVLTVPVASAFAFDTLVPAFALAEALVAAAAERLGDGATARLERMDDLNRAFDRFAGSDGAAER